MQRSIVRLGAGIMMVLPILVAPIWADEEKVPLDKVPAPILETVKARFKDAKITGASKETEDGKLVYEVTIKHMGHNIDVTLTPKGELLMIEKEIAAKDLPKAVTKALEDKYPKATYKVVEEVIKVENKQEKLVYFEAHLVTADRKGLEVQISPEGKILHEEKDDGK